MNFGNAQEASHGSAAIGWISNTDSMLLCVVILAAISAVFHNRWTNAIAQNTELQKLVGKDLKDVQLALAATEKENKDTQRRVESLLEQLQTANTLAATLRVKLQAAEVELATLRPMPQMLKEVREALALEQLARQQAELKAAEFTSQIGKLTRELAEMSRRNTELAKQLREVQELVVNLQGDRTTIRKELADVKAELARERIICAELLAKGKELYQKYLDAYNKYRESEKNYAYLYEQYRKLKLPGKPDRIVKRKLLGLEGNLQKVAIILDASGSMKDHKVGPEGKQITKDLWTPACGVVNTWLELLEMKECVFIVFNATTRVYPEEGLLNMELEASRVGLQDFLKPISAEGGTNTRAALELVYNDYPDVDTIILFTDGGPNNGKQSTMDKDEAKAIISLCEMKGIPVNTVGLGNYFEPLLGQFLQELAYKTKGAFLGR